MKNHVLIKVLSLIKPKYGHKTKLMVLCFGTLLFQLHANSHGSVSLKSIVIKTENYTLITQQSIKGLVTDANNTPLPGVSVLIKGSDTGVATDFDGNYEISASQGDTLIFSYIGFSTKEITLGFETNLNVTLIEDISALDEVVVIGYGTQKEKDLTGSVTSVSEDEIRAIPVTGFDQALQGRAAGVQVTSNTGQPGGGVTVRIRGVGSLNNNDPLYVIDGIPIFNDSGAASTDLAGNGQLQNPLSMLNPNDIESMEILKDASATAIYGSRAANGVVLVTTKSGKKGKLNVNFETFHGFNRLAPNNDLLDSRQWAGFYAGLLRNSGREDDSSLVQLDEISNDLNTPNYDWARAGTQIGYLHNYQLNLSGGSDKSTFYIGGNYVDEAGTVINSNFKRYGLRINTDHNISKRIKVGNTLSISRTDQLLGPTSADNGAIFQRLQSIPTIRPIYTENGEFAESGPIVDATNHFIANLINDKQTLVTDRVIGSVFGEIDLWDGLSFKSSVSIDNLASSQQLFLPPFEIEGGGTGSRLPEDSSLTVQERKSFTWFTDNYFTYSKVFSEAHDLSVTLGQSVQYTSNKFTSANVQNFIGPDQPYLSAGINQGNVAGGEQRNSLASFFARFNYVLNNKYLLTGTVRRDGSSRFGENNKYGTFPAFSVGWRVSEENFLKDSNTINNLKIRASWGITGGQEIGNYTVFNRLSGNYNYIFGNQLVGGFAPLSLANPDLQWEETKQTNFGLNLGLFNNRISLTADYFIKNTTKLLLRVTPTIEQGTLENPFGNLGEIQNKGIELGLNTVNVDGEFRWTSDLNFTAINNEVLSLANNNEDRLNSPINANFNPPTFITQVGGSIGQFYVHEVEGIFQSWDEVYNSPFQNTPTDDDGTPSLPQTNITNQTSPGDLKFRDLNNDGTIDAEDRVVSGKIIPDFTWGFTNNFSYKGFGLSLFLTGVKGVDIYNGARAARERMNNASNQRITVLDAWNSQNTQTSVPRAIITDPNNNNRASTRWIEDGSFVRVKNIRLSYNLPEQWLKSENIKSAQIYLSAVNPITFTKYTGYDPELGNLNQNPEFGNLDAGQYPQSKQFLIGIRFGL